jgi:transcriptional regulator with XRE-family HTH domain
MGNRRTPTVRLEARRTLQPIMRREGAKVRAARRRRRWRQIDLGARIGLSQSAISAMERGQGGTLSVETWQLAALALGIPFDVQLRRDSQEEPADAGHLAIQELALRLGRTVGYARTFELATRSSDPARSTDVGLRDDRHRRLVRIECVNTFGDIGAAVRSSDRKDAEAGAYAIAIGHGQPYAVHTCWIVRATRRNRELLARYPEIFAARFPGSSLAWVRALTTASPPPVLPGLVWCDVKATRLIEWRRGPRGEA